MYNKTQPHSLADASRRNVAVFTPRRPARNCDAVRATGSRRLRLSVGRRLRLAVGRLLVVTLHVRIAPQPAQHHRVDVPQSRLELVLLRTQLLQLRQLLPKNIAHTCGSDWMFRGERWACCETYSRICFRDLRVDLLCVCAASSSSSSSSEL